MYRALSRAWCKTVQRKRRNSEFKVRILKKKKKKKAQTQFFFSHAHNPLYKCLSEAERNVTAYITSTYCSPPRLNCHVFISFILESAWFEQPEVGSYIQKVESPWHNIVCR